MVPGKGLRSTADGTMPEMQVVGNKQPRDKRSYAVRASPFPQDATSPCHGRKRLSPCVPLWYLSDC